MGDYIINIYYITLFGKYIWNRNKKNLISKSKFRFKKKHWLQFVEANHGFNLTKLFQISMGIIFCII